MGTATLCHYQNIQSSSDTPFNAIIPIYSTTVNETIECKIEYRNYALICIQYGGVGTDRSAGYTSYFLPDAGGMLLLHAGDVNRKIGCGYTAYVRGDSGGQNKYTQDYTISFTGTKITTYPGKYVAVLSGFAFN